HSAHEPKKCFTWNNSGFQHCTITPASVLRYHQQIDPTRLLFLSYLQREQQQLAVFFTPLLYLVCQRVTDKI
ncbi:MAG: hypothetical protein ACK5T6_05110, partial [Pirellula sp.]